MIKASQNKIKKYTKFLRKKLLEEGYHKLYVKDMSDKDVLGEFRKCCECDEEVVSPDQQMHAILEFDTPERIFEVLYEDINCNEEFENDSDEDEDEDEDKELIEITFDHPELEGVIDFSYVDIDDKIYDEIDDLIDLEASEDSEENEIIRGKWVLDGVSSIKGAIESLKSFAAYLEELQKEGYELSAPIEGDVGVLEKE
jgi:hypothetical protein